MSKVIELGHTYAPDRLIPLSTGDRVNGNEFLDTASARRLRELAKSLGRPAVWVALLDDVVMRQQMRRSEDPWRLRAFLDASTQSVRAGTRADVVCYESAFELEARKIVDVIRGSSLPQGARLSKDENRLLVGSGNDRSRIPLVGFREVEDPTYPSCQVLDLAWLNYKLTLGEEAVTILSESYENQQRQVAELARITGVDMGRVTSVFVENPL